MSISNFRLTDDELLILKRNLDKLAIAYHEHDSFSHLDDLDFTIMHQDMATLSMIRDDIELYFDDLEMKAKQQMMEEENA
jgi:hypothetical protein